MLKRRVYWIGCLKLTLALRASSRNLVEFVVGGVGSTRGRGCCGTHLSTCRRNRSFRAWVLALKKMTIILGYLQSTLLIIRQNLFQKRVKSIHQHFIFESGHENNMCQTRSFGGNRSKRINYWASGRGSSCVYVQGACYISRRQPGAKRENEIYSWLFFAF